MHDQARLLLSPKQGMTREEFLYRWRKFSYNRSKEQPGEVEVHCGGYAKLSRELVDFVNGFSQASGIAVEPVYSGKMLYGLYQMIAAGAFGSGSHIVAIHTGGMQGLRGMQAAMQRITST